jgi:hypothetical protein
MDGPGANGLRGGRGSYPSGKTAIGVWLDSKGGPSGYKRGFHANDYETEGQHQQRGAQFYDAPLFGAELPPAEHLHRKPPKAADLFDKTYSKEPDLDYMTNTTLQYRDSQIKLKESHLPMSNMPRKQLEEYQKTWSSDTPAARVMRFQTEARRAGNAANKNFQTPCLRLLPGTPSILEGYRDKLLGKYGVLALTVFRYFMGVGEMTCQEWRQRLALSQIKLFPHEVNQMLAYFTASDSIDTTQFVRTVTARNSGYDMDFFTNLYIKIFGNKDTKVTFDDFVSKFQPDVHVEVVEGIKEFAPVYCNTESEMGLEEFIVFTQDLYSCCPVTEFPKMIEEFYGLGI